MYSTGISSRRTRIAAHFNDTPVEGEAVTVEGWLTYYDEDDKSWKPMKGKIGFFVDNRPIGNTESNELGFFTFTLVSPAEGKHSLEVRFRGKEGYEPSTKKLEFRVLSREDRRRIMKFARNVFIILVFICLLMFLVVFIAKFF
jgi:hypothetical protein